MQQQSMAIEYALASPAELTANELSAFVGWIGDGYRPLASLVDVTEADVLPEEFMAHWRHSRRLLISSAHSEHPVLTPAQNVEFRALHDHHHLLTAAGFGWAGELATYHLACATAPEMIHWILRSEILLQAAYKLETGEFAEQKLVRV